MHSIHPPRKKHSGRIHLPHNTMVQNHVSDCILIETEIWHNVKKPYYSQGIIIADNGYSWVKKWQEGANFCIRKTYNEKKELVAIYIDICSPIIKSKGEYGFTDWYLDIWVDILNHKQPVLLDEDEFAQASKQGYLSTEQQHITTSTATMLLNDIDNLLNF